MHFKKYNNAVKMTNQSTYEQFNYNILKALQYFEYNFYIFSNYALHIIYLYTNIQYKWNVTWTWLYL